MFWKPRVFIMLGILIFTVPFLSSESVFAQEKPETKQEKLYTFDFSSANIVDIIRLLSKEYNVNIVAGEEVQGKVSGHFTGTLEETLKAVLKSAGNYVFVKEKDIFRIIPSDKIDRAYLITRIITLKYLDAEDVNELVKELLSPIGKTKVFVKTYR